MRNHGIEYRDYQIAARGAAFTEFERGTESALIVMPTGTGKTVLAGMCVEEALSQNLRTLFLAHREVLITQAYNTLSAFGFDVSVEMGQQDARKMAAVAGQADAVVGSVQTLQDDRLMRWSPHEFGLIIIDECHRSLADSYTKILNWFSGYSLLGITATPGRGDGRNLGARFTKKVFEYPLRRAITEQWLVPLRTRECPISVDLKGVKLFGGDFSVGELEERIGPKIEQLARGFMNEVGDRPAVAFLPDVGSAMAFAQVCSAIGQNDGTNRQARYVAGAGGAFGMGKLEKNANLLAFNEGQYQIIVCCELLIEGWDCPRVSAVGILRPTKQQYRYAQMVGRGLRLHHQSGKRDCLVVDFDWETEKDAKDLCSTIDLFDDGSIDWEVFAVARQIMQERAVDYDPSEILEEADRIITTRQRFMIQLSGKTADYKAIEYNPVGVSSVLGLKLNRKYDLDKQGRNPASDKQLGLLRSLGVEVPDGVSKWGASKLIDKIMKRRDSGLASVRQLHALLGSGVNEALARQMSAAQAKDAIQELDAIRPRTKQATLFS
jgi:superfamily II DNA or RNA helicase